MIYLRLTLELVQCDRHWQQLPFVILGKVTEDQLFRRRQKVELSVRLDEPLAIDGACTPSRVEETPFSFKTDRTPGMVRTSYWLAFDVIDSFGIPGNDGSLKPYPFTQR